MHNVHAGHRFADSGQNGLFKFSIAAKAHAVCRNHQRDDQNVNLRAGENKGVSVRLEQREEEVALVKPGEEVDKRDGDNRRPDHIFAANPLGDFRVAEELPRQIKQQPRPQPILW